MEAAQSEKTAPPFGRYLIRERIAQGGMGEVFMAVAVGADGFEKPVVVKRLLPKFAGRAEVASLLSSEAKLMTRLVHPNIVQVIDFGRGESDDYFLVMELVQGADLGRFCEGCAAAGKPISVGLALFITLQVLRGLAHAHSSASADGGRLVHRDISPGNVLVSTFGEVKVADFGVALIANSAEEDSHDGWFVGKPAYMAPEQLERGPIDERADIYGVGAVLFQALTRTSHRPEIAPGENATERSELSAEARQELASAASPEVAAVILRALAPRREERFSNAREMARAIEQLVETGEKIATADDLASAVTDLVESQPRRGQSVVLLSGGGSGLASGTELTHIGARGSQGFTIKMQDLAAVAAARGNQPASRSLRWLGVALAVVSVAVVAVVAQSRSSPRPAPGESTIPGVMNKTDSVGETASSSNVVPVPIGMGAASGTATGPRAGAQHVASAHSRERPATTSRESPPPTKEVAPECRGQIHLYAAHGWVISGGPSAVQAPGRYEWACGTYVLTAVSRVDPNDVRTVTVVVRETTPGVIDLR